MALEEFYNTGDDIQATITTTTWYAQTWTTTSAYTIASVKLKLYDSGAINNFVVSIRATTTGKPSGGDLTSGSISSTTITDGNPGSFVEIDLTPYALSDATQYAIVCRVDAQSASWRVDNSSPSYGGGNGLSSSNSGSTWNAGGWDSMFEIYSGGTPVELSGTVAASSTVTGNMVVVTAVELSGTISAQSSVGPSSLGSVSVGLTVRTAFIKRLVVAGNNQIWYESI